MLTLTPCSLNLVNPKAAAPFEDCELGKVAGWQAGRRVPKLGRLAGWVGWQAGTPPSLLSTLQIQNVSLGDTECFSWRYRRLSRRYRTSLFEIQNISLGHSEHLSWSCRVSPLQSISSTGARCPKSKKCRHVTKLSFKHEVVWAENRGFWNRQVPGNLLIWSWDPTNILRK